MPSILWEALHIDPKELRAFRESSVATKWRKHAITGIMCIKLQSNMWSAVNKDYDRL